MSGLWFKMLVWVVMSADPASSKAVNSSLLARTAGEVALAQAEKMSADWQPQQRDCAGLVRYAVRTAYKRLNSPRLQRPLFTNARGEPADFADAATLVQRSFVSVPSEQMRSGDVLAFMLPDGDWHLMMVVAAPDRALFEPLVVYHNGEKPGAVRAGRLRDLEKDAPARWRPDSNNPNFLGAFRFKEWS